MLKTYPVVGRPPVPSPPIVSTMILPLGDPLIDTKAQTGVALRELDDDGAELELAALKVSVEVGMRENIKDTDVLAVSLTLGDPDDDSDAAPLREESLVEVGVHDNEADEVALAVTACVLPLERDGASERELLAVAVIALAGVTLEVMVALEDA